MSDTDNLMRNEIEIEDTSIVEVKNDGITYIDELGRKNFLPYATCASNAPNASCVAERDITKWYFRFYTANRESIKIVFKKFFVFKKGKRFLVGGKAKRFSVLQQAIVDSGYTTYDLS